MKAAQLSHEIWTPISPGGIEELKCIERIGRMAYKSEDKITEDDRSARAFVQMIVNNGHGSVLEHGHITVHFTCDRGISHELVRHRHCAFTQESTRYCNYSKEKFGGEITVIKPPIEDPEIAFDNWLQSVLDAEDNYLEMIRKGVSPQTARSVLPTCLKTELVLTTNYREWRAILGLRTSPRALPEMRTLMTGVLEDFRARIPIIFDNLDQE